MNGPRYAELLCRTNHSFLVGASRPNELVERAVELGLHGLAITDRDGLYGMPKAYRAWKSIDANGAPGASTQKLKLLIGAELTVENRPRLTLLARDRQAYGVLCRMITASHEDRPKGEPLLTWDTFLKHMNLPGSPGLIALPAMVLEGEAHDYAVLRELFGRERLYLPLMRVLDGLDEKRTRKALALRERFGIDIIATNDVHYHVRERRILHDVLTSIREGVTLAQAGKRLFPNGERHLKSATEMAKLFSDLPEALANTVRVAESCTFSPAELRYRYPSEWIPAGETAQTYLRRLVEEGARVRYAQGVPPEVRAQIDHELSLIAELYFADYFLTIWEIVEFARSRKILCQGRGSAANSVVCYCLGITAIDPINMNLLFERFISVERGEPPDIDVDFEHERREEVIQHIYEKYGRHRAGMVAALITYRGRSSLREVSKVLEADLEKVKDDTQDFPQKKLVHKVADEIYGFPRHLSIHSGGFTLSADPLIETVPIEPARMEGRTVVQWDKDDLDAIGLLKVDVLSLGMLSALRKTCDMVGTTIYEIPHDDPKTYEMIQKADTVGVFQIESRAQMSMLPRLLPKTFYDLVVQVAIVRPGPIVGKMVHPYLRRRRGLEPIDMPHPKLIPILTKTYGVPIFQEQVMKIAIALAGFTPGEADELRRAIGAWRSSGSIEKVGKRLMEGLLASNLPREFVERIFLQIQGFSEYGFPESHAASFALLAYFSSYLKCHHPAEFTCALINSQPMGFYSNHTLIDDAKRHGVRVRPIDPNVSEWDCTMEDGALRLGFRVVLGMGEAEAQKLVEERRARPFTNFSDFLSRIKLRAQVLQRLAMGDAFASFGYDQRHALWKALSHEVSQAAEPTGQLQLFTGAKMECDEPGQIFTPLDGFEEVCADYSSYRLSVRGHPMQHLRAMMKRLPRMTTAEARALPFGRQAAVAGLVIVRQRPQTAKGTVFATLEDEHGFLDLILHNETFEKFRKLFSEHTFLIARGTIQRDGESVHMLIRAIDPIWPTDDASKSEVNSDFKARSWH